MSSPPTSPTARAHADAEALAAAAERRAHEHDADAHPDDSPKVRELKKQFRRLVDPGIVRPNTKEIAVSSMRTLLTLSGNLLREPENPKFQQFKPTNNAIKKNLVDVRGALEYAVALGFHLQIHDFQPQYVFNKRHSVDLQVGHSILKEWMDKQDIRDERELRAKKEEKATKEAALRNVMLAFDDDRKTKRMLDEREKQRQAAATASAHQGASGIEVSPPAPLQGGEPSETHGPALGPPLHPDDLLVDIDEDD